MTSSARRTLWMMLKGWDSWAGFIPRGDGAEDRRTTMGAWTKRMVTGVLTRHKRVRISPSPPKFRGLTED